MDSRKCGGTAKLDPGNTDPAVLGCVERALRTLSAGNRALLRSTDEKQLLQEMCRVIVEEGGYRMAWVGYAQEDAGKSILPMAHAGFTAGLFEVARMTWAESAEEGIVSGKAIRSGKPCVSRHIVDTPDLSPHWREEALKRGYGAVSAFPLEINGVLGNLTIFSGDPDAFGEREVSLLAELAEDLAFGIRSLRTRCAREQAEARLQRTGRALRTLSAGNRNLLRAANEQQLLEDMCRAIVDVGGYRMAWVGYAEHDADKTVTPMAHAGVDMGLFDENRFTWADTERGQGPMALAIRSGKPRVRRDFRNDPGLAVWRDVALKCGYEAASAFPLRIDGEVIGALSVLALEIESFEDDELAVLAELADDLAFGIATLRLRAQHREAESTIRRLAYSDPLTGLPNRARLKEYLADTIVEAKRQHRSFALLVLNGDRFREINDVIGFDQGDALLGSLAQRLKLVLGESGLLARVGGDEFVAVLPGAGAEHGIACARHILQAMDEPFEFSGIRVELRVSIGISLFPGHGATAEALIRRADAAMYQAKRGHSGYAVSRGEPDQEGLQRLAMIGDLRRGIEDQQLRLYCQPKASMQSSAICGAEALVRWQHPTQGLIYPDQFIPLAERTGLITPLTYWMLDAALGQCYAWREAGITIPLAVNLSAHNLQDPRLMDRLSGLLTTWGAEPDWLQFELTESALMEDPAGALEVLNRMRAMGFRLFVDDFGTGYSSLSYLHKLPLYAMKIDKSFVLAMGRDEDSRTIVHSTIELGHNIGLEVVAEGTENQAIWDQLSSLGNDVAQGSFISDPFPAEQFPEWRAASPWQDCRQPL